MSQVQQTGRTTEQMQKAPRDAVFVWCNGRVHYPRELARALGRHDLQIMPSSYLRSPGNVLSCKRRVVVDHAFFMHHRWDDQLFDLWQVLRQRGLLVE